MKKIVLISLALVCAVACNKAGNNKEAATGTITVNAGIRETKVAYDGNKATFEAADDLALFAWIGDKTAIPAELVVNNVTNILGTDGLWAPVTQMLWYDMVTPHYFMAVSPSREVASFGRSVYPGSGYGQVRGK